MNTPSHLNTCSQTSEPAASSATGTTRTRLSLCGAAQPVSRRNLGKLAAAGAVAATFAAAPHLVKANAASPVTGTAPMWQVDESADAASPSITDETGAPIPVNSEIRKIADDALDALKRTFSAVALDPTAAAQPDSLEDVFKSALAAMSVDRLQAMQDTAAMLENLPVEARAFEFGRYGQLDAAAFVASGFMAADSALPPLAINAELLGVPEPSLTIPVSQLTPTADGLLIPAIAAVPGATPAAMPTEWDAAVQAADTAVQQAVTAEVFDVETFAELWGEPLPLAVTAPAEAASAALVPCDGCLEDTNPVAADAAVADAAAAAAGTKLHFYIRRIKCVDETNPEWWGSDEVALGGAFVTPTGPKSAGWWETKKIPQTSTWGGFDDGNTKTFSPPLEVTKAAFPLGGSAPWPRLYSATLVLAEKDQGGLSSAIDKIWNLVGAKVKAAIAAAIAGAVSATVLGSVISAAVAYAVSYVIERFVQWVINRFKDDIFAPAFLRVKVPSPSATWNGSRKSPVGRATFSGHGGQYSVEYYWQIA